MGWVLLLIRKKITTERKKRWGNAIIVGFRSFLFLPENYKLMSFLPPPSEQKKIYPSLTDWSTISENPSFFVLLVSSSIVDVFSLPYKKIIKFNTIQFNLDHPNTTRTKIIINHTRFNICLLKFNPPTNYINN